jgi:hypothetical protein
MGVSSSTRISAHLPVEKTSKGGRCSEEDEVEKIRLKDDRQRMRRRRLRCLKKKLQCGDSFAILAQHRLDLVCVSSRKLDTEHPLRSNDLLYAEVIPFEAFYVAYFPILCLALECIWCRADCLQDISP